MAKVFRHHRYHGLKYVFRQTKRRLIAWSAPLAFTQAAVCLLLPWLVPLGSTARTVLGASAVISGAGALIWQRRAAQLGKTMEIIAAGHDGEGIVARRLAALPREWGVLNDLALRVDGPIVQIDHLVIAPAGVFVIETKAQKGEIITAGSGPWQVRRRGHIKPMANPVEQNQAQVRACRRLLKKLGQDLPCHGLVVMTEATAQVNWPLTDIEHLRQYLLTASKASRSSLKPSEIRELARELLQFQVTGRASWDKGSRYLRLYALTVLLPLLLYIILWLMLAAGL